MVSVDVKHYVYLLNCLIVLFLCGIRGTSKSNFLFYVFIMNNKVLSHFVFAFVFSSLSSSSSSFFFSLSLFFIRAESLSRLDHGIKWILVKQKWEAS